MALVGVSSPAVSQSDFVTRGQALVSSGQFQEAVKVCRLGLLGRPTTVEGRVVLGQALLALKRYDEVLAEMRVALELDRLSAAAQLLKGEALLRKGDGHGAVEALVKLRDQAGGNAQIAALLDEAERMVGRAPPGTPGHTAAFARPDDSGFGADGTKNYPAHELAAMAVAGPRASAQARAAGIASPVSPASATSTSSEDSVGEYTRPTSVAASTRRRSSAGPAQSDADAGKLAAGSEALRDGSGTVEVDPGLEIESGPDDDFGDPVEPPVEPRDAAANGVSAGARGASGKRAPGKAAPKRKASAAALATTKPVRPGGFKETSTVELDEEEMVDVEDLSALEPPNLTPLPLQAAFSLRSATTAAQQTELATHLPLMAPPEPLPSPQAMRMSPATQPPYSHVPLMQLPSTLMPEPFAQLLPQLSDSPLQPPQAMSPQQVQAQQLHQLLQLQGNPAATRATAMNAAGEPLPAGQDARDGQRPSWPREAMLADAAPQSGFSGPRPAPLPRRTPQLDQQLGPQLGSMGSGHGGAPAAALASDSTAIGRAGRSGVRKARSRLQLAVWVLIGAAVIGGGVFAGFQIRSMRLRTQIVAARERSVDLAKTDTWQGWLGARDSLRSIAQASPTIDNKAALARTLAVLAYEFGDSVSDAKTAVEGLAGYPSLDGEIAAAYLALAQNDAKAAGEAAERAVQVAPDDPAAFYVSGQAALLVGDARTAVTALRRALDLESRPLYAAGLANALRASSVWDEAVATVDRSDNPAAVIAKGFLVARRAMSAPGNELRAQLAKLVADSRKPATDAPRGASPTQVAFAYLALAQVDFARNDAAAARTDYQASLEIGLTDQRFAEELVDTLYSIGELENARKAAAMTFDKWPASRRARTTLAQIAFGLGKPVDALDIFTKTPDAASWPKGQVVRGQARLATGDVDGARADFDAALKKLPDYEPALIARAWLDLASGDRESARRRIEPNVNPRTATAAMLAVYAAILRAGGDPVARDKAKGLLEHVVGGPSPDIARVQLELARIDRDVGDIRGALAAYADAGRTGNFDARFEGGLLQIEAGEPRGGRDALEQLLKEAGEHPGAALLVETARARTLTGAHAEAAELLALADRAQDLVRWQLDRERARLALSRSDAASAARGLLRALDTCGADLDTFILAADTISADDKQTALATKLKALAPTRLRDRPEIDIIAGKLDLAAGRPRQEEAAKHYLAAREALVKESASPRRVAQANYGLAAVAYDRGDDPTAVSHLAAVMVQDPTIYAAYLFAAEIAKPKNPRKALELAQQAVVYNPDSVDAWKQVGTLAAQLTNRKLLNEAIGHVSDLAPGSDTLRQLQKLR